MVTMNPVCSFSSDSTIQILNTTEAIKNLIKLVNTESALFKTITVISFSSIYRRNRYDPEETNYCASDSVKTLLEMCHKFSSLNVITIKNLDIQNALTISNIPSLKTLSINHEMASALVLDRLENLTEIEIGTLKKTWKLDLSKYPKLENITITKAWQFSIQFSNPVSLKTLKIHHLHGTRVTLTGGSDTLKTLVLGDEAVEDQRKGDKIRNATIEIKGIYKNLQNLHIRSLCNAVTPRPFHTTASATSTFKGDFLKTHVQNLLSFTDESVSSIAK